jgi:hypothetical protein
VPRGTNGLRVFMSIACVDGRVGGGKRTVPKRWDVAGLPAGIALDYGETGKVWVRRVPGASCGTAGFSLGTPSGHAGSCCPSVRIAGEVEGSAVAEADVVKSTM